MNLHRMAWKLIELNWADEEGKLSEFAELLEKMMMGLGWKGDWFKIIEIFLKFNKFEFKRLFWDNDNFKFNLSTFLKNRWRCINSENILNEF
jgi:hypothetical protein